MTEGELPGAEQGALARLEQEADYTIQDAARLLRRAVDLAAQATENGSNPYDFIGIKTELDDLDRERATLYHALGSPAAQAVQAAHIELTPIEVVRTREEFEAIAPLDDFRKVPAISVQGHRISMGDFPEHNAAMYARLAVLQGRGIDWRTAVEMIDLEDDKRNRQAWGRLSSGLSNGTAVDSVMSSYLQSETDPENLRNKVLFLQAPAELPHEPHVTAANPDTEPDGVVLGTPEDRMERLLYLQDTVTIDGRTVSLEGLDDLNLTHFMAKWAHLTEAAERPEDHVFTTHELRDISAAFAEGVIAQKEYVLGKLRWLSRGDKGLEEVADFYSYRAGRDRSGRINIGMVLLADPDRRGEYWSAFYESDRFNERLDRLTGENPIRTVTIPLTDYKMSPDVPEESRPSQPVPVVLEQAEPETDVPGGEVRGFDDGLAVTSGWPKRLFLDGELTSLSPEAALIVEMIYERPAGNSRQSRLLRQEVVNRLREEDTEGEALDVEAVGSVIKSLRTFLIRNDLINPWR